MALTATKIVGPVSIGDRWLTVNQIAFDNSFASGGESLTRANLGFSSTADSEFTVIPGSVGGYLLEYDYANQKLLAYIGDDGDPGAAADAEDLSALTATVVAIGRFAN